MKKRVLSALLALCMACTLAGNVWAAEETEPTPAPSAGVEAQTVEPQTVEPTPSAEPTQAPAPSPDATAEPEATPEPSAAPSAAPDATVEPDATPAPTEEPEAPAAPAATATPDATAEPTATPAPTEVPAATATPEPSDEPEATAVPAVAYVAPVQTAEDQQINVHVDVPEGAFAENVAPTLHAQLITGETEEEQAELDKAAAQVAEQTGAAFDGMLALDVYFTDANAEDPEQEIEPALPVSVRLELSENVLPEGYDPATLAVHHLAEEKDAAGEPVTDENGETAVTVETVANAVTDDAEVPGVVALSDAAAEAAEAPAEVARIADLPAPETAATPADEQAAAEAEQALTDPAVVAEFEVESFSVFTVSWSLSNDQYFDTLTVQRINVDGTGVGDDFVVNGRDSGSLTVQSIANEHPVEGYDFVSAVVASSPEQAWQWQYQDNYKVVRIRNHNKVWQYNAGNSSDNWKNIGANTVYFLYRADGRLTIDDSDLLSEGRLLPKYADAAQGSEYVYKWERKAENGNSWELVERRAVTEVNGENLYNVAEDGSWLNVSLDGGARYTYRVKLVSVDGATVTGEIVSPEYKVPYYDSLQNGSFENPDADGEEKFVGSGTEDVVWKTTGRNDDTGSRIELVGNNTYMWHGVNSCPTDGIYTQSEQCAELNADSSGALYQDVLTTPGSTMYWSLMHNGRTRNGNSFDYSDHVGYRPSVEAGKENPAVDTMYVVIMSTADAEKNNITTQEQVENIISGDVTYSGAQVVTIEYKWFWTRERVNNSRPQYKYILHVYNDVTGDWNTYQPDNQVSSVSVGHDKRYFYENETVWRNHTGQYHVPENQYLTRYFFVAGSTELGGDENYTVGNHIDNVHFSTTVPPAADGTATLTIQKAITGLTNDDYEKLKDKLTFTVRYGNKTITLYADSNDPDVAKMSWWGSVENGGTATGTYVIQNIPIPANGNVSYTVTEKISDATVDGYTLTTTPEATDENVSVAGTLGDKDSKTATITNTYEKIVPPKPVTPEFHKYIEDTDDGTYDLSLDVHGTIREDQNDPTKVDIVYVLDLSYSMMWDMNGTYPGGDDNTSGDNQGYNYTFARYNAATTAIDTLNGALNKDGIDARAALITFAPDVKTSNEQFRDVETWNNVLPAADWSTFASGTNYGAALNRAKSVIRNARSDAQTVVIFITDGEPNRALDDHGQAVSANTNEATQYAENEVKDLNVDRFYAVGVGDDEYEDNLRRVVNAASNATEKHFYKSSDRDELAGIFQGIAADITSVDCTNVVITDTLSKYAQLTDDATFRVSITNAQEQPVNVTGSGVNVSQASAENGATVSFTSGDNEPVNLTVKYTPAAEGAEDNGTFTLTFPADYALENGWVYTITTDIEPTQEAYDEYAESGYGNTKGDLGTDAPENDTSSDHPGFHSNDKATLTYTSAEQLQEKEYPHPVIQVKNGSLTIDKNVVSSETSFNVSALGDISFTFTVQGPDDVKGQTYGNVVFDSEGIATVTIAKDGSLTIEGLPAGPYTVTETNKPDSTDGNYYCSGTTYKVGTGNELDQPQAAPVSAGTETTVTVENTYAKYRTVTITKDVTGGMGDTTRFFNFTAQTGTENNKSNVPQTNMTAATTNPATAEVTDDGEFKLKDDGTNQGSVTINKVRQDETLTITEESVAGEGYTTTNTINGVSTTGAGNIATVTPKELAKGNVTVKFENDRPVVTPTGLETNHTKPYALMVGAGALAGLALVGGILARRARRRREW